MYIFIFIIIILVLQLNSHILDFLNFYKNIQYRMLVSLNKYI